MGNNKQISFNDEIKERMKEIEKKIPDFNYSELFQKSVIRVHNELFSDDLRFLRLRYNKLIEEQKERDNEIKTTKEKIKKIELDAKFKELENKNPLLSDCISNITGVYELEFEDAKNIAEEFLSLNPNILPYNSEEGYKTYKLALDKFIIQRGIKLKQRCVETIKQKINVTADVDKKYYEDLGYKFDF